MTKETAVQRKRRPEPEKAARVRSEPAARSVNPRPRGAGRRTATARSRQGRAQRENAPRYPSCEEPSERVQRRRWTGLALKSRQTFLAAA